jgi:hypothetical protein
VQRGAAQRGGTKYTQLENAKKMRKSFGFMLGTNRAALAAAA